MLYIVTAVSLFGFALMLILWAWAKCEAKDAADELAKAAKVNDELRKDNELSKSMIDRISRERDLMKSAGREYLENVKRLESILSTALIRNSKGQLERADGLPTDPKRIAKRERAKAKRLARMTDLMLQVSGSSVVPEKVEPKAKAVMDHFAKEDEMGIMSVGEIEIDVTPKKLTRAEACLAILNEAKEAGFEWAESGMMTHITNPIRIAERMQEAEELMDKVNSCMKCDGKLWLYDEVGNQTGYCGCYYLR